MKIVIDIPDSYYNACKEWREQGVAQVAEGFIAGGIPYERPTGHWIRGREIYREMIGDKIEHIEYKDFTCSECGLVLDKLLYNHDGSPFYNFCPKCGVSMLKGAENERK